MFLNPPPSADCFSCGNVSCSQSVLAARVDPYQLVHQLTGSAVVYAVTAAVYTEEVSSAVRTIQYISACTRSSFAPL